MKKDNKGSRVDPIRALIIKKLAHDFNYSDVHLRLMIKDDRGGEIYKSYRRKYVAVEQALNA